MLVELDPTTLTDIELGLERALEIFSSPDPDEGPEVEEHSQFLVEHRILPMLEMVMNGQDNGVRVYELNDNDLRLVLATLQSTHGYLKSHIAHTERTHDRISRLLGEQVSVEEIVGDLTN